MVDIKLQPGWGQQRERRKPASRGPKEDVGGRACRNQPMEVLEESGILALASNACLRTHKSGSTFALRCYPEINCLPAKIFRWARHFTGLIGVVRPHSETRKPCLPPVSLIDTSPVSLLQPPANSWAEITPSPGRSYILMHVPSPNASSLLKIYPPHSDCTVTACHSNDWLRRWTAEDDESCFVQQLRNILTQPPAGSD
jgi:hypothetical protein